MNDIVKTKSSRFMSIFYKSADIIFLDIFLFFLIFCF